jgi:mRNA interferase MazF
MARDVGWGDVRLVEFGGPQRTRPALVLTRPSAIPYLNAVTVAPITRTVRGIPTELALGVAEGLNAPSVAHLDSIQTVRASRLGRYLGSIAVARRAEVRAAVLFALGLEPT